MTLYLLGLFSGPAFLALTAFVAWAWANRRWPRFLVTPLERRHDAARLVRRTDAGMIVSLPHHLRPLAWLGARSRWVCERNRCGDGWVQIVGTERHTLAPLSVTPRSSEPMLDRLATR